MRFEIIIYNNSEFAAAAQGDHPDPAVAAEWARVHQQMLAELKESDEYLDSNEYSQRTAAIVRADRRAPHHLRLTDGPFSESKEWVGGFYTVDCESLERAVEIAGRFVEARYSQVEVRKLVHPIY
jgi:hypothetical protein